MAHDANFERVALTEADMSELREALGDMTPPTSPDDWDRMLAALGRQDPEAARRRIRLVRSQVEILKRHGFEPGRGALAWDPELGLIIEGARVT